MLNASVPQTTAPKRRLTSLDAVRGIAAFVVILHHCYLAMPDQPLSTFTALLSSRPLRVFHNGGAAVIIFFVLSGYVLALPFFSGRQPSYTRYVVKRICRIYIPFAVALCIAVLLYTITDRQPVADAADWLNTRWPVSWPGFFVQAHTS